VPAGLPLIGDFTIDDLPTRLAAIIVTWGTLSVFYPYFNDQHTDWPSALSPALVEAAASGSPVATHTALAHLVATLRDNHARSYHPAVEITGRLPLAFRRFGDKIFVIGGLPEYTKVAPRGTEVMEFDGVPALAAYTRVEERVSAATDGWRAYSSALNLGLGSAGTLHRVRVRLVDGSTTELLLPMVSRELYGGSIRDPRPQSGTEIAHDIYYVDFDTLSASAWVALLPTLQHARGVIFDFRGYQSSAAFTSLGYLTEHEIQSPRFEIPLIGPRGLRQPPAQWSIRPAQPRLTAPVVALTDGQSMSAVETFLQIFRDNHLGYIVGEPSGGTNGNFDLFNVPGGFSVRFTAMRVVGADGIAIQGRGIVPDQVVAPTLEGVRAGRDEVLEAGIAAAQRLAIQ
jgi:hypothetical protein